MPESRIHAALAALIFVALSAPAWAQSTSATPVGAWRSIDDKTGEAKAEIRIAETGGVLSGRITRRLVKDAKPNAVCEECKDERKGQPIEGLEIIRGARQADGREVWEHGKILDPENGREYTLRMAPIEGGKRLEVRGYLGPFYRSQVWVRVQ